jgi:magnesium-transporting ATPase (P-type)
MTSCSNYLAADVGLAMGLSGTEAAKRASGRTQLFVFSLFSLSLSLSLLFVLSKAHKSSLLYQEKDLFELFEK